MRGDVEDIQILYNLPKPTTFFLEKDSIAAFSLWIQGDENRSVLLGKQWDVIVFRYQIRQYPNYRRRYTILKDLNITLNDDQPQNKDSLYFDEVERTYFSNSGVNHRQLAEFYVMARRAVGNGWINVISQDRAFERVPMVNTCFIGTAPRTGEQDLPAQFDFIQDFKIHPNLARAIANRLDEPVRGSIIFDSITVLRDYIRLTSGINADGYNLMDIAFKDNAPIIKLNPHTDMNLHGTQRNEQQGFHDLYCGLMKGMRNPLAHEGAASAFSVSRYSDKAKMLKYLSFLSILFERVDGPLP